MANVTLTNKNVNEYARKFIYLMLNNDGPVPKKTICEELGLTVGQVSSLVKYMRRCAEKDLEKFIPYYPISSKQGYKLPHGYNDFLPCFTTLFLWCNSLARTIEPMRRKMLEQGINVDEYIKETKLDFQDNYLDELIEMNADTSWFIEKEDYYEEG